MVNTSGDQPRTHFANGLLRFARVYQKGYARPCLVKAAAITALCIQQTQNAFGTLALIEESAAVVPGNALSAAREMCGLWIGIPAAKRAVSNGQAH